MYQVRVLKTEIVKSKRTIVRSVPFFLAIVIALVTLFLTRTSDATTVFHDSVTLWFNCIAIILPLITGLMSGVMGEQEFEAADFLNMRKSNHRQVNFIMKNIYLLGALAIFLFMSMLSLVIEIWVIYKPIEMNLTHVFLSIFIFMAGSLFLVPLNLYISFSFGLGPSIGIGVFGTVFVSYLSSIPLISEQVWRLIPWAWSVKSVAAFYDYGGLFFHDINFKLNMGIQLIAFMSVFAGTVIWFEKWEGRNI